MALTTVKSSTPHKQDCHYRPEGSYFNPSIICLLYRGVFPWNNERWLQLCFPWTTLAIPGTFCCKHSISMDISTDKFCHYIRCSTCHQFALQLIEYVYVFSPVSPPKWRKEQIWGLKLISFIYTITCTACKAFHICAQVSWRWLILLIIEAS